MQVTNKNSFITTIYSAIIVNKDTNQDPLTKGRVQIFIPTVNYDYADVYQDYINDDNKPNSSYFTAFPWAVTLTSDLKNGDEVYGSYIEGNDTQFIVLGIAGGKSNLAIGGANIDGSNIVNLTMPIVLHNEIGVSLSAWADDTIPDSRYQAITLHDGGKYDTNSKQWIKQGSWSIGLIQWNGVRAYDLCYEIAKGNGNWRNAFSSDIKLKTDLVKSLNNSSSNNQRGGYGEGYNPEKGGETYNSILKLLSSDSAKATQKQVAYDDTAETINMLIDKGCNNPAILIYLADFYNQYGSGHSGTTQQAVTLSQTAEDIMQQLDKLILYIKSNFSSFNTYQARRNATYSYIKDLYNCGKLTNNVLTDEGGSNNIQINPTQSGQYCVPFVGSYKITATWGKGGYPSSGGYHTGIDFGCPKGTKILACTNGTISIESDRNYNGSSGGYGRCLKIMSDDGYEILCAHLSQFVVTSGTVTKGQLIGYSGNTGNSTGAHLHFEIRKPPFRLNKKHFEGGGDDINPLPFIGMGDKGVYSTVQGS